MLDVSFAQYLLLNVNYFLILCTVTLKLSEVGSMFMSHGGPHAGPHGD